MNAIFIPAYNSNESYYYWTGTCDVNSNYAYCIYLPHYSWESIGIREIGRTYNSYYNRYSYIRPVYVGS